MLTNELDSDQSMRSSQHRHNAMALTHGATIDDVDYDVHYSQFVLSALEPDDRA